MRFLFLTDTHIRGTAPRSRKDNFIETVKRKLQEVGKISEENNVDYILHGGDWFDRPDISPAIVREIAVIVKNFMKPVLTIAGNHDMFGQNPETLSRTMLGLLEGTGVVRLIDYEDLIILDDGKTKVQLTGKPYRFDIDGEEFKKYYIVRKNKKIDYAINIVHGMLLDRPFINGVQYTLLKDISDTEADITLSGHYHTGFGIKRIEGRYYANPGSLVRITRYMSEIERTPKVILIDMDKEIKIKEIELKSALPGEEVLDRDKLERVRERRFMLQRFYRELAEGEAYSSVDMDNVINDIASRHGLGQEVREEVIRRIKAAREDLGGEDS